jgi:GWxTD domain-containing protein
MIRRSSILSAAGFVSVLWQLLFSSFCMAQQDSTITFEPTTGTPQKEVRSPRVLEGIVTLGLGPYEGYHDGAFKTHVVPDIGFDFLARPVGINLVFGGKLSFTVPLSTGVHLGLRETLSVLSERTSIFGEAAFLFFDDSIRFEAVGAGFRGVIGSRIEWSPSIEIRLAGEYRGNRTVGLETKTIWWAGLEAGAAFTLSSEATPLSYKDSVRAAILYIARPDELAEFDALRSAGALEFWLEQFWHKRDITPSTPINENRREYESRVRRANIRYSRPKRLGIETDVGRVLAIYGEPDATESEYSVYDANYRYELWVYRGRIKNIPTALFLFEVSDPLSWRQIYSNVPGELSGPIPSYLPKKMRVWF